MPRIVCISDTHGLHDQVVVPNGDILVHAGDCTEEAGRASLRRFLVWFEKHPHPHKVLTAGNHDWAFEKWPDLARAMVKEVAPSVTYLQDESVVIDGLKIHGSSVSPRFFDWAFNRDRGPDIQRHWDLIPDDTDLLITHGPAMNILDEAFNGPHVGCANLADTIASRLTKLRAHCHGHIHAPGGKTMKVWYPIGTHYVTHINASVCNEAYRVVNAPIVIDL